MFTSVQPSRNTVDGRKSCTTWDVWNPVTNGINYLSIGAGFLPSTVSRHVFPEPKKKVEIHHESHLTGSWIVMLWMKPHLWSGEMFPSEKINGGNLQLVFKKKSSTVSNLLNYSCLYIPMFDNFSGTGWWNASVFLHGQAWYATAPSVIQTRGNDLVLF